MALPGLDSRRFWDERYPLENVETILKQGHLRPANGLHPALTHLPHTALLMVSDALYELTGDEVFAVFDSRGNFSSTTYFICRMLQALFGAGSVLVVFLIGRRLGDDRLGLVAALLVSVVPWHLRQSVTFKSDIVLIFSLVLTFYLSLRAIERPTLGRYAAAGAGVGLALSSKFNGGPIAIPLMLGTLLSEDRSRRTFLYLVCAGVVSLLVFFAINPYVLLDFSIYQDSFGRTLRVYERHGVMQGVDSKLTLLSGSLAAMVSGAFHGPLIGGLGLVGIVWLSISSIRSLRDSDTALGWLMVVSFLVSYPILYVASTNNPSTHNWLPMSPFLALVAAWTLLRLWDLATRSLPQARRRILTTLAAGILVLVLAWGATRFVYQSVVPSTGFLVLDQLTRALDRPAGRTVISEHYFGLWRQTNYRKAWLALDEVADLGRLSVPYLNRFDAEVFPASRLKEPGAADFYRSRLARVTESRTIRVEPKLFKAQGPALVALLHPLKPLGKPGQGVWVRSPQDRNQYRAVFPDGQAPIGIVSFEFGVPGREVDVEVRAGDQNLQSITFRAPRLNRIQTTPRFRVTPKVTMRLKKARKANQIPFVVRRWRRPKAVAQDAKAPAAEKRAGGAEG
jgi:hypothetical protein